MAPPLYHFHGDARDHSFRVVFLYSFLSFTQNHAGLSARRGLETEAAAGRFFLFEKDDAGPLVLRTPAWQIGCADRDPGHERDDGLLFVFFRQNFEICGNYYTY